MENGLYRGMKLPKLGRFIKSIAPRRRTKNQASNKKENRVVFPIFFFIGWIAEGD